MPLAAINSTDVQPLLRTVVAGAVLCVSKFDG